MSRENNCPIKYAAMPIITKDQIPNYITTRCYLISETKKYLPSGQTKENYEVVFTFNGQQEKIKPKYDFSGNCLNSTTVLHIFDDFEKAKDYTSKLNHNSINDYLINTCHSIEEMAEKRIELEHHLEKIHNLEEEQWNIYTKKYLYMPKQNISA